MMELIEGLIQAESGQLTEEELIDFVKEHKEKLLKLQGSWVRCVQYMEEEGLI